jgi:hypothetical protein
MSTSSLAWDLVANVQRCYHSPYKESRTQNVDKSSAHGIGSCGKCMEGVVIAYKDLMSVSLQHVART